MTEVKARLVVVDAGPIIHLDELEALAALGGFDEILLTRTVRVEILRHCKPDLSSLPIQYVEDPKSNKIVEALSKTFLLHAGERAALSLSTQLPGALFATDDMAARLAGEQLGLKVHGSLGLLIRSVRLGLLSRDRVLQTLESVPFRSTLHIKSSLLSVVIERVKDFDRV